MSDVAGPVPDGDRRVRRYAADSQLRDLPRFVGDTARGLRAAWPVSGRLLVRDLRSRYRQSVLGYVWLVVPTVATTVVWVFLNRADILNAGETSVPYPVYVLVGTALWQSFTEALGSPVQQLSGSSNLLAKMNFPAESLLLAGLGTVLLNGFIRVLLTIPVVLLYGVRPGATVLLAPVGLLAVALFGFGVGLVLAPFGALYRDIPQGLTVVTAFWFLVTPVAYQAPDSGPGRLLAVVNPVAPLINVARYWLTGGPAVPGTAWWVATAITVVLVLVGWSLVRLALPHLVDRIGT